MDPRLLPLGLLALAALAGCPSCPYESHCEGNVLQTCTLGVDQMVGEPERGSIECSDPNAVCVTLDERVAQCAMSATAICDVTGMPYCVGDLLVGCQQGYEVATDCSADGNACTLAGEVTGCFLEPPTGCDPQSFESRCQGDTVIRCASGYLTREQCGIERRGERCVEYTNDYGRSAYCSD